MAAGAGREREERWGCPLAGPPMLSALLTGMLKSKEICGIFAPPVRPFIAASAGVRASLLGWVHSQFGLITVLCEERACWRRQRRDGRAGRNGPPLSVARTPRQWHSSQSQRRPPSQSSNKVLHSGRSPLLIQILSKSSSRHWIRCGECPRSILRWTFGASAHPWQALVCAYALAVDLP